MAFQIRIVCYCTTLIIFCSVVDLWGQAVWRQMKQIWVLRTGTNSVKLGVGGGGGTDTMDQLFSLIYNTLIELTVDSLSCSDLLVKGIVIWTCGGGCFIKSPLVCLLVSPATRSSIETKKLVCLGGSKGNLIDAVTCTGVFLGPILHKILPVWLLFYETK